MTAQETTPLNQYLEPVAAHKKLIAVVAITAIALGVGAGLAAPTTYSSTTSILVYPVATDPTSVLGSDDKKIDMPTEIRIAASQAVAASAAEALETSSIGLSTQTLIDGVTASSPKESSILDISFVAPSAGDAQAGANAIAEAYLRFRTELADKSKLATETAINERINLLNQELGGASPLEAQSIGAELDAQRAALADLSTLTVDATTVIDQAGLPEAPEGLSLVQLLVGAVAGGLALGVVAAYAAAALRRSGPDVEQGRSDDRNPTVNRTEVAVAIDPARQDKVADRAGQTGPAEWSAVIEQADVAGQTGDVEPEHTSAAAQAIAEYERTAFEAAGSAIAEYEVAASAGQATVGELPATQGATAGTTVVADPPSDDPGSAQTAQSDPAGFQGPAGSTDWEPPLADPVPPARPEPTDDTEPTTAEVCEAVQTAFEAALADGPAPGSVPTAPEMEPEPATAEHRPAGPQNQNQEVSYDFEERVDPAVVPPTFEAPAPIDDRDMLPVITASPDIENLIEILQDMGRHGPIVGLTLGEEGVGTSIAVAFGLADALQALGANVLMIDAALEDPLLARLLSIDPSPGLAEVLTGAATLKQAVRPIGGLKGLDALAIGQVTGSTVQAIAGPSFERLIAEARVDYHTILVIGGTPTDRATVPSLAALADGLIVGTTQRPGTLARADLIRDLVALPAPVLDFLSQALVVEQADDAVVGDSSSM